MRLAFVPRCQWPSQMPHDELSSAQQLAQLIESRTGEHLRIGGGQKPTLHRSSPSRSMTSLHERWKVGASRLK